MISAVGPAAIVAAAVAVPLFYLPRCESPFADPKLALLLVAGGLGLAGWLIGWGRGARQDGSRTIRAALAALGATTLLATAGALRRPAGAPYAAGEIVRLLAIVGVAAGAAQAARDPRWRRRLFEAIAVAAGMVSLIGIAQHLEVLPFSLPIISVPGATLGNRNMGGEAVAMALPFAAAVLASQRAPWRDDGAAERRDGDGAGAGDGAEQGEEGPVRFWFALGVVLASLVYLAITRARGAWIGGAAGIVAFAAVRRPALPRRAALLLLPLAAGLVAVALLPGRWHPRDANDLKRYEPGARVVLDALDPTSPVARTRLGLWRRTLAMYRTHPFAGVGPGNFPVLFPLFAEPGAAADGVMSATMVPRRPHNELLERLAETGPLGVATFAALFVAAFAAARAGARRGAVAGGGTGAIADRDAAAAAAGAVGACFGCGLTAFPLAMPATALLFGASLGVLDALAAGKATPARAARRVARSRPAVALASVFVGIVVTGAACLAGGVLASAYGRGQARAVVAAETDRGADVSDAVAALTRAARAPRLDSTRFDIALRTAQLDLRLERGPDALEAAERALSLEPYSPHAWAARAGAELALRDEARAAGDAAHALSLFFDLPAARTTLDTVRRLEAARADEASQRRPGIAAP